MARPHEMAVWETESLAEHVRLIQRQVDRSLADPETRRLALKIVGHKVEDYVVENGRRVPVVYGWGNPYRLGPQPRPCPMNDTHCEINALWNFAVLNIRYVLDPDGYDLFSTVRVMLDAHAEDCDGFTIYFGAMLRAVGFANVFARVISSGGKRWEHVYTMVGVPKQGAPRELIALDPTVPNVEPGWEFPNAKRVEDFRL